MSVSWEKNGTVKTVEVGVPALVMMGIIFSFLVGTVPLFRVLVAVAVAG